MEVRTVPETDRYGRRVDRPVPAVWFADAVEKWARNWGRSAVTRWEPRMGCFVSHFSRRDSDPVLAAVQEGRRAEADEPFYWHEWKEGPVRPHPFFGASQMVPGFVALDVEQMGETGVLTMLEKGNTWSGRGEFTSIGQAADASIAANDQQMEAQRKKLRDGLEGPLKATIRHARGDAQVSVPDNITSTE